MKMWDYLSSMLPFVEDETVALDQTFLIGNPMRHADHMPQQHRLLLWHIPDALVMGDGNDEQVHRSMRMNVPDDNHRVVTVEELTTDIPSDNFTEHVVCHRCYFDFNRFFNSSIIFSSGMVS